MHSHKCPVCGQSQHFLSSPFADAGPPVSQCVRCHSAWLDPIPSRREIKTFYPPEYYGAKTTKFITPIERLLTKISARTITRAGKKLSPSSRVLDIGCGRGLLLRELSNRGFDTHGTELNMLADQSLSSQCTIHITDSLHSLQFPNDYFDLVIIWHVLEHVSDPQETISEISRILSPDGQLALAVPNFGSMQSRIFGRSWFHLDLPRHIFHFTLPGLEKLLESNGLRVNSANHFSLIQNSFGWMQSILNQIPGLEINYLYNLLHNHPEGSSLRLVNPIAITHVICAALILPLALALTLAEGIARKGGTIELIAKKPPLAPKASQSHSPQKRTS